MRPGTASNPPRSTADAAGRPVITARVPTTAATWRRAGTAPGCARALAGSATMGDSVPSKSSATRARPGSSRSAASPARPSGVTGTGSAAVPVTMLCSPGRAVAPVGARRPHPVPPGPLPAQPGHQGRVEHECLRTVDEIVQQLVVTGRGHAKGVTDLLLLGPRRAPPATLEGEDPHL